MYKNYSYSMVQMLKYVKYDSTADGRTRPLTRPPLKLDEQARLFCLVVYSIQRKTKTK